MRIFDAVVDKARIDELNYSATMRKQQSIGKQFPSFHDRTKAVNANGGVRLVDMRPEVWHFKVASGTEAGLSYDVYLKYLTIDAMIKKWGSNRKMWKADGSGVNYNLIAPEILNQLDMESDCSCPSDLYQGAEYLKTQRDAQYDHPEYRAPKIRNPKGYGLLCKHAHNVFARLPFYTSTFASYLKKFYANDIADVVKASNREVAGMKGIAKDLDKRQQIKKEVEPHMQQFARGGRPVGEVPSEEEPTPKEKPKNVEKPISQSGKAPFAKPEDNIELGDQDLEIDTDELPRDNSATTPANVPVTPKKPKPPEDKQDKGKYRTKG